MRGENLSAVRVVCNSTEKIAGKEVFIMQKVTEIFGSYVFDDATMKERLPKSTYQIGRASCRERVWYLV